MAADLTESGRVIRQRGDQLWVQTLRQSACDQCRARATCGQPLLARLGAATGELLLTGVQDQLQPGETVVIRLQADTLVRASLLAYLTPLVTLLLAMLLADWLWADEIMAAVAALAGLLAGVLLVRQLSAYWASEPRYSPRYGGRWSASVDVK